MHSSYYLLIINFISLLYPIHKCSIFTTAKQKSFQRRVKQKPLLGEQGECPYQNLVLNKGPHCHFQIVTTVFSFMFTMLCIVYFYICHFQIVTIVIPSIYLPCLRMFIVISFYNCTYKVLSHHITIFIVPCNTILKHPLYLEKLAPGRIQTHISCIPGKCLNH